MRFLIALVHDSQCEKLVLQVFPAILVFLVENGEFRTVNAAVK